MTSAPVPGFLRRIKGLRGIAAMNTVTRAHLAEAVYASVGLSRNESAALLETVLERMSAAFADLARRAGVEPPLTGDLITSLVDGYRREGRLVTDGP